MYCDKHYKTGSKKRQCEFQQENKTRQVECLVIHFLLLLDT